MESGKKLYQSKTAMGAVLTTLSLIAQVAGVPVGIDDIEQIINLSSQLVGIGLVIYGRFTASEKISSLF